MGRIWRSEAGIVLLSYFIACVAGLGCAALGHPGPRVQQTPLAQQAPWLLLTAFLTWRVWRTPVATEQPSTV
jgi:RsiW-degrading membrane proteinase PrsW (M82 family)